MKFENWEVDHETSSMGEEVEKVWRNESTSDKIAVERNQGLWSVFLYFSDGQSRDFLFEHENKTNAMDFARCWMRHHHTTDLPQDNYEKEKMRLSEEGRRILDETGYQEVHIPIFYEEKGEYLHLTVDFVSEESPEVEHDVDYDTYTRQQRQRERWVAENLYQLLVDGKIMVAYDDGKISNPCELVGLKSEIDVTSGLR
jgi:hypothetical protein